MATPRTWGRFPRQRDRPALPTRWFSCSRFPTWPTVALQRRGAVAGLAPAPRPRHHLPPDAEPDGRQDVTLLAVLVVKQRDARRAVRVVLDRRHLRGNPDLLAPEVDLPVAALVAATPVPRRH